MAETVALIVAAGRGARADRPGPKQYEALGGQPVIVRSHDAFAGHPDVDRVFFVIHGDDVGIFSATLPGAAYCIGGADRQASVRLGLEALAADGAPVRVLIHDGARPLVTAAEINRVLAALKDAPGALCALRVTDTLKRGQADMSVGTHPREGLFRAQTPQAFLFDTILTAHRTAPSGSATDDASLLEAQGVPVALIQGDPRNIKLTYPEDFAMAETLLAAEPVAGTTTETRTGLGYDVHAFTRGDHVTLGGVRIAHTEALLGHSDADVAMHAITDAIYGALGAGDIGRHFPPTEERWRGAASEVFLSHAAQLIGERGGRLVNADITIICEAPKVAPHAEAMRDRLANIIGCDPGRVSIKATTTEKLGFTGRREGIAAEAIASIELPR